MSRRVRLDAELVRRGMARSRDQASELIAEGKVKVAGMVAHKAATQVTTDQAILVSELEESRWVSRGAHKLIGALEVFEPLGLTVSETVVLDAGASTGGFSQVLLERGVSRIHAVDVGYGQLAWKLQQDPRINQLDRTNVRSLTVEDLGEPVDLVVSDLSFISLTTVLPALSTVCQSDGDMVLMIKPQFEVGKDKLGKNGVVREPELHVESVHKVTSAAARLGWGTRALAPSPLPGPAGNIEYFCWLTTTALEPGLESIRAVVAQRPHVREGNTP
ncbi:MAG: TlyA family RNA methyltransferase [Actinomycetales bacterium]|nr:TlyA family RNA methyltransferase [Actinomycetales bacterium]